MLRILRNQYITIIISVTGLFAAQDSTMHVRKFRILALGDSYTIGEAVLPDDRWPVQLAERLKNAGLPVNDPEIIAQTGWTTGELAAGIKTAEPKGPFDLVTLLIGVNNQYRGRDPANFRSEFRELLYRAIGYAAGDPGRVIVVSIPDWGVTPFAADRDRQKIANDIDLYNSIKMEESGRAGIMYIDITSDSRAAADDTTLIAGDGLHPSASMYRMWVDRIYPAAYQILFREKHCE